MAISPRDNLIDYLEFQREEGRTHLSLSRAPEPASEAAQPTPAMASARKPVSTSPAPSLAAPLAAAPNTFLGKTTPELTAIAKTISGCTICPLHKGRTNTVPGQGNPLSPDILFVGEGPGEEEDLQGLAFIGRAGQLLTKMIEAMGYNRDQIFIANIVKCRPPNNRQPEIEEMDACMPYLLQQIRAIKPKVIIGLGATAVKGLIKSETGITKLRGTWLEFEGIPFMPTYHPAYLLRNPPMKKDVWEDLKSVLKRLGKTPPTAQRPNVA